MKTNPSKFSLKAICGFRWTVCGLIFAATTINYMDRQVLALIIMHLLIPKMIPAEVNRD